MQVSLKIDDNKIYTFPEQIDTVTYKDKILVIAPQQANWIVLNNPVEVTLFNAIQKQSLKEVMAQYPNDLNSLRNVLIQVEARKFYDRTKKIYIGKEKLHIYLTNECNMRCPHCYMFAGEKMAEELTFEEICSIIKQFAETGGREITFSGGEIAMRRDLFDIVQYSHNLGVKNKLLTNGTLWTSKTIDSFAPLVSKVQVSIDGFDEKENSKIRGRNSFSIALNTVDMFIKAGVPVDIAITPPLDDTLESKIDQYAEFGKSIISKYPGKQIGVIYNGEILDGRNVKFSEDQKKRYSILIEKIYQKCFGYGNKEAFFTSFKDGFLHNNCSYGSMTISATGDVYLCSQIPFLEPIGNIRKDSWNVIQQRLRQGENKSAIENLKPCNTCTLKYICGGGCRIKYFKEFKRSKILTMPIDEIAPRTCSESIKEYYYDLMIASNPLFFR